VRTGYFAGFGLERKSDMTIRLVELIEGIRQKFGPDHAHVIFRTLLLDNAGEQQHNNAEFNKAKNSINRWGKLLVISSDRGVGVASSSPLESDCIQMHAVHASTITRRGGA
jgi:hypothetical protein